MKTLRPVLLTVAAICLMLLGVALYLQHALDMLPCPLCVIQRYAFAAVAVFCLVGAFLPRTGAAVAAALAGLSALAGAGVAGWHLWIKSQPSASCGIDPLETSLNTIPSAKLLPFLFEANGLCSTEYPPILGLSIPQWSLIWFVLLFLVLAYALRRHCAQARER